MCIKFNIGDRVLVKGGVLRGSVIKIDYSKGFKHIVLVEFEYEYSFMSWMLEEDLLWITIICV